MPKRPVEKTFDVRSRIKKNDPVKVIAGRDKGKTGRVISVDRWRGKLLVEGVSHDQASHPPQSAAADQGRHRREGKRDLGFERDDADFRRRAHAGRLQDGARAARPRGAFASPRRAARRWIPRE